jgi:predicted nucleotidyltransferase
MNTLNDIKKAIKSHHSLLEKNYGVRRIGVFGSFAHGTQSEESDIDILVELEHPLGWEIVDLKLYLEELLGKEVDLVTIKALRPELKDLILRDVVYT